MSRIRKKVFPWIWIDFPPATTNLAEGFRMLQAVVEISEANLLHNIQTFRRILSHPSRNPKFCAVVKSNAYGHGIREIANLCIQAGVDVLGVNNPEEAEILRSIHRTIPILIMGDIPYLESRKEFLSDPNLWVVISRLSQWEFLASLDPRPRIHIKVDTGMGRLGSDGETFQNLILTGRKKNLPLDGIATHFASTEDFTEHSYSRYQLAKFLDAIRFTESAGYQSLIRHCASSASTLLFDDARLDMVRIGISLYGLWPSTETRLSMSLMNRSDIELKPVISWKTKICHVRELPAGSYIGYGSTYKTTYPTRLAVIPVGYYEGLDRKLSNNGYFIVKGERSRILGRICMNMSMIDITHIPGADIGDEVVLLGRSGEEELTADMMASWTNTINYEIVTRILPTFQRVIIPNKNKQINTPRNSDG